MGQVVAFKGIKGDVGFRVLVIELEVDELQVPMIPFRLQSLLNSLAGPTGLCTLKGGR